MNRIPRKKREVCRGKDKDISRRRTSVPYDLLKSEDTKTSRSSPQAVLRDGTENKVCDEGTLHPRVPTKAEDVSTQQCSERVSAILRAQNDVEDDEMTKVTVCFADSEGSFDEHGSETSSIYREGSSICDVESEATRPLLSIFQEDVAMSSAPGNRQTRICSDRSFFHERYSLSSPEERGAVQSVALGEVLAAVKASQQYIGASMEDCEASSMGLPSRMKALLVAVRISEAYMIYNVCVMFVTLALLTYLIIAELGVFEYGSQFNPHHTKLVVISEIILTFLICAETICVLVATAKDFWRSLWNWCDLILSVLCATSLVLMLLHVHGVYQFFQEEAILSIFFVRYFMQVIRAFRYAVAAYAAMQQLAVTRMEVEFNNGDITFGEPLKRQGSEVSSELSVSLLRPPIQPDGKQRAYSKS